MFSLISFIFRLLSIVVPLLVRKGIICFVIVDIQPLVGIIRKSCILIKEKLDHSLDLVIWFLYLNLILSVYTDTYTKVNPYTFCALLHLGKLLILFFLFFFGALGNIRILALRACLASLKILPLGKRSVTSKMICVDFSYAVVVPCFDIP